MPGHAAGVQRASTGLLCMDLCVMVAGKGKEEFLKPSLPLETTPNDQSQFDQHALLEKAKNGEKKGNFTCLGNISYQKCTALEKCWRDIRSSP